MRFYKRDYELLILAENKVKSIKNLKISFEIIKTIRGVFNRATIDVYNLNDDSISMLKKGKIIFKVGYEDNLQDIFIGEVKNVITVRQGVDTISTIYSSSADKTRKNSRINKTYKAGANLKDVIEDIIISLDDDVFRGEIDIPDVLIGNTTLEDDSLSALEKICEDNDLEFCINDEILDIFKKGRNRDIAVKLTANTGLIGSPSLELNGIRFKSFLNPLLIPYNLVEVDADQYQSINYGNLLINKIPDSKAQGFYKIIEVTHMGDSTQGEWVSEVICHNFKPDVRKIETDVVTASGGDDVATVDSNEGISFAKSFETKTGKFSDKNATNLQSVVEGLIERRLVDLHTSLPAFIDSFNPENQTANVQIAIKRILKNIDDQGEEILRDIDIPVIQNVPVVFPSSNEFSLTIPVKRGDEVLLIFSERSLVNWYESTKVSRQKHFRKHDFNDAIALVGLRSKSNIIDNFDNENLEIKSNNVSIKLTPTGELNISADAQIKLECPSATIESDQITVNSDSATINSDSIDLTTNSASITANSVDLTSPANTINGNLTVNGAILGSSVGIGGARSNIDLETLYNDHNTLRSEYDAHVTTYNSHTHSNGNNGSPTGTPI